MRTNLQFRSSELLDPPSDDGTPRGEIIARLLGEELPNHGFSVSHVIAEDWGWQVRISHDDFPLWVGCGHYEEWNDGILCFIEPKKRYVRRWLRRLGTADTVERLATAVETVVRKTGKARDLRWWTDEENARG